MPELIPGLLGVGVLVAWAASEGGFFVTASAPGGLFLLGLLGVSALAFRGHLPPLSTPTRVAIGALTAFAAWSFLSIIWAGVPGDAWDGANRSLVYLVVFALFAILPWSGRSASIVLGSWSVGVAVVGLIAVLDAAGASEPILSFVRARFAEPTGYHNATAALFASAFWPAMILASRREVAWPLRGVLLATAGVLFELSLLPQSRGWLIIFPLTAVVAVALTPGRARLIAFAVPVAVAALLAARPILDVYDITNAGGDPGSALDTAIDAIRNSALALFVAGLLAGGLDAWLELSDRVATGVRMVVGGLSAIAAVVAAVVAIGVIGNPVSWTGDRWEEFKAGESETGFADSRLGGQLGSNRYDFWRVAIDAFKQEPLIGIGADNFASQYVRHRHSDEEPQHPHSMPVAVLSQEGLVGAVLLGGFLVITLIGGTVAVIRASPLGGAAVAGGLLCALYWLGHGSADWFWELPALSGPAFAWLGLASSGRAGEMRAIEARPRRGAIIGTAAAGGLALLAAASLFFPLAARVDLNAAAGGWGADPKRAFELLDRAAELNPLSARAPLVKAAIAGRLGQHDRMRMALSAALDRDSGNWYAVTELGALDALEGHRAAALRQLGHARALNPREPLIDLVATGARRGRPVALRALSSASVSRVCMRLGRGTATRRCTR